MKFELKDVLTIGAMVVALSFGYGDLNARLRDTETKLAKAEGQAVQIGKMETSLQNLEKGIDEIKRLLKQP